ncbi:MAG TPA: protocatechuate 3,4-dioxygenase [Burkholderiales bacterium]|nr:protocatechuate 3,4-dioxygenase [Burkholderiales bacterium]
MKRPLVPTPSLGDANGLAEARAARRKLLAASLAGAALASLPWRALAQARVATPQQTAGPFYPREFPADGDNDLVAVKGRSGLAKGEPLLLAGAVMDVSGRPFAGARVEIWQCNAFGRYHHPGDGSSAPLDPNFQGWGEFVTGADGDYRFRTIKPVPYPGRTPHIHFRISGRAVPELVTQMYIEGEPGNGRDGVLGWISDPRQRAAVIVRLDKAPDGKALAGRFDIVLRATT